VSGSLKATTAEVAAQFTNATRTVCILVRSTFLLYNKSCYCWEWHIALRTK